MSQATVSQIRSLLKYVLPLIQRTLEEKLDLVAWVQARNRQATLSHRKTSSITRALEAAGGAAAQVAL